MVVIELAVYQLAFQNPFFYWILLKTASSDASVELLFLSQSKQCNKLVCHPNHWVSDFLRDSVDSAQCRAKNNIVSTKVDITDNIQLA